MVTIGGYSPMVTIEAWASGLQAAQRQLQYLAPGARAVVGGHEVAADEQRERHRAPVLDLLGVGAEGTEQRPHVLHPAVVHALEPLCDRGVAAGPVADGEV